MSVGSIKYLVCIIGPRLKYTVQRMKQTGRALGIRRRESAGQTEAREALCKRQKPGIAGT